MKQAMTPAEEFKQTGFKLVRELFSPAEVEALTDHVMALRQNACPNDDGPIDPESPDPLQRYPRLMHPHRWDETSRAFMLNARLDKHLTELLGESPIAVQTMVYFKPPGARGQALHQDQFYLLAEPGTCAAAWLALDDCDEDNGCMSVVPGSHDLPVLCLDEADTTQSFTDVTVQVPPGLKPVPMIMKKGDVLFFNGQLIHGSGPNTSSTRFRRAYIAHYVEHKAEKVGHWYHPCYNMDGTEAQLETAPGGDVCGRFVGGELTLVKGGHLPNRAH